MPTTRCRRICLAAGGNPQHIRNFSGTGNPCLSTNQLAARWNVQRIRLRPGLKAAAQVQRLRSGYVLCGGRRLHATSLCLPSAEACRDFAPQPQDGTESRRRRPTAGALYVYTIIIMYVHCVSKKTSQL